ncbi:hypothetical protein EJB05_52304 [Eragrostis curvula]|uniref:Uncharacterized protein n=1 Tax=Eragrostis curvula TaxID=38414 RepID=A0A5J9STB0_9POAL|nr:hypothetical protein EJB05_52304 [Eragrostis curvula]
MAREQRGDIRVQHASHILDMSSVVGALCNYGGRRAKKESGRCMKRKIDTLGSNKRD